mgnify:CR=1 FL=1
MAKIIKTEKLDTGEYLLTYDDGKKHKIDKKALELAIQQLEQEILEEQELLKYKKGLLAEINKIP